MKEKIKKHIKKCCIIAAIILVAGGIFMFCISREKYKLQYMNQLDYKVTLKDNGEMEVTEIWDIYIKNTNTIFKNFDLSDKFGMITDVTVTDLETGKQLKQIYREMYHVTTDCYYALEINNGKFEIAWGTGMEESKGRRKYQVKYTVTDVTTQYRDCQEVYWKFLDSVNAIPIEKVNIRITLPSQVQNNDNLLVWGHGPLNGKINKISNDTVEAEIPGLSAGRMLEIRLVTKEKIFNNITPEKNNNYKYLDIILGEETKWANKTNGVAQKVYKIIKFTVLGIYAIIIIVKVIKLIVYNNIYSKKEITNNKLQYFRDIPRESEATPAEANYLYNFQKCAYKNARPQSNVIAGTVLDLCLKGYIGLKTKDETVYVEILKKSAGLSRDEKDVYSLLANASKRKKEFDIQNLNKYAKKHYSKYNTTVNDIFNASRDNLYRIGLVDKNEERLYSKADRASYPTMVSVIEWITILTIMLTTVFGKTIKIICGPHSLSVIRTLYLLALPLLIIYAIEAKILTKIKEKIAILTQKGEEERAQWKGLANYIKNYSLLNEKKIETLATWEKYLVYATTFGIAKKAIQEMHAEYPEVFVKEYWEDDNSLPEKYPIIRIATYDFYNSTRHTSSIDIITSNIDRAYQISLIEVMSHTSSSGSGGGGGFSSGGGGRWRSEAGMGGR